MTRAGGGPKPASPPPPAPPRSRRLGYRLALAGVALVGSLVAAELTLQVLAAVAARTVDRGQEAWIGEEGITVLSLGDSHTFGLPLPAEESYPAQLEAALRRHHPEFEFQVVNLGIPGANSSFVANRLERQMFQLRPDLVIVWVGVNNIWNVAETRAWQRPDRWLPLRQALLNAKLFRFASILWFSATGHQYDPAERGGWFDGERRPSGHLGKGKRLKDPSGSLAPDLRRMVELARSLETPMIFVTYPLAGAEEINRTIRVTGGQLGVAVIDSSASLERAFRAGHLRPELIDERSGPHPSALLYRYLVEDMLAEVEAELAAWHGIEWAEPRVSPASPRPGP